MLSSIFLLKSNVNGLASGVSDLQSDLGDIKVIKEKRLYNFRMTLKSSKGHFEFLLQSQLSN